MFSNPLKYIAISALCLIAASCSDGLEPVPSSGDFCKKGYSLCQVENGNRYLIEAGETLVVGFGDEITLTSQYEENPGYPVSYGSLYVTDTFVPDDKIVEISSFAGSSGSFMHIKAVGYGTTRIELEGRFGDETFLRRSIEIKVEEASVEAVDLGLSVKWASCNLGARNPQEYGEYFQWTSDDPATKLLGSQWRTPSLIEWQELESNCKWETFSYNEVKGYRVSSTSGSIFLPYAGWQVALEKQWVGTRGSYWSSTPSETDMACTLLIDDGQHSCSSTFSKLNYCVIRPVRD